MKLLRSLIIRKQSDPVSVLMVAIGGYGYYYLKTLFEKFPSGRIVITGVVDPNAGQSVHFPEIKRKEIPVFSRIEDFYNDGYSADLAVIASPIHYHVPQTCTALEHGSNVLCEKPAGAVVQDVDEMIKARDKSGKWVMIGYQWSYSEAIQSLKRDILEGLFGKPVRLKTLRLWHRDDAYFQRNNWAGKIKDADGRWILDSPANNALAHELHNLFYILGGKIHLSAEPKEIMAEVYRANKIENFDTTACRIYTNDGSELLFYGSHTTSADIGTLMDFRFEDAVILFNESSGEIIATDKKGNQKTYGSPDADHFRKLFKAVKAVRNPETVICGPEAARSHTLCINGIQESVPEIPIFPESMIQRDEKEKRWWVKRLDEALYDCYQNNILPSEADYTWAKKGKTIDLSQYSFFPTGKTIGQDLQD